MKYYILPKDSIFWRWKNNETKTSTLLKTIYPVKPLTKFSPKFLIGLSGIIEMVLIPRGSRMSITNDLLITTEDYIINLPENKIDYPESTLPSQLVPAKIMTKRGEIRIEDLRESDKILGICCKNFIIPGYNMIRDIKTNNLAGLKLNSTGIENTKSLIRHGIISTKIFQSKDDYIPNITELEEILENIIPINLTSLILYNRLYIPLNNYISSTLENNTFYGKLVRTSDIVTKNVYYDTSYPLDKDVQYSIIIRNKC